MLIIIEGADLCGKTTLAERLAAATDGQVIHAAKPTRPPLEEYSVNYSPRSGQTLILDRWHWGERVWPFIFKRTSQFDWRLFDVVEMRLRAKGAVVVYAHRDPAVLGPILDADPEEPIGSRDLADALILYEEVMRRTILPTMWYNFEEYDGIEGILEAAEEEQEAACT